MNALESTPRNAVGLNIRTPGIDETASKRAGEIRVDPAITPLGAGDERLPSRLSHPSFVCAGYASTTLDDRAYINVFI